MNDSLITNLFNWFNSYVKNFYGIDEEIDSNILLKQEHTYNVVQYGKKIASNHFLPKDYNICIVSCLLHDIGRFEQFKKYRTFRDSDSEDHSSIGINIVNKYNLLSSFSKGDQQIIKSSIFYHNKLSIPDNFLEKDKKICALVRDADKLDIFRVLINSYENPDPKGYVVIGRGLSDEKEYTDQVLNAFLNKKAIKYSDIVTKDDLKLLQIAWIFDLNFDTSIEILKQKNYIPKLIKYLPDTKNTEMIINIIDNYLDIK